MFTNTTFRPTAPLLTTSVSGDGLEGFAIDAVNPKERPHHAGAPKKDPPRSAPRKKLSPTLGQMEGYRRLAAEPQQYLDDRLKEVDTETLLSLPVAAGNHDSEQQTKNWKTWIAKLHNGPVLQNIALFTNIITSPHFTPMQKVFFCCGDLTPREIITIFFEARKNPQNRVWVDAVLADMTLEEYQSHYTNRFQERTFGNPDHLWPVVCQELTQNGLADLVDGLPPTTADWMGLLERIIDLEMNAWLSSDHKEAKREAIKTIWQLLDEWFKASNDIKPAWHVFIDKTVDRGELKELGKAGIDNLYLFLAKQHGITSEAERTRLAQEELNYELKGRIKTALTCDGKGAVREFMWSLIVRYAQRVGLDAVIAAFDTDEEFAQMLAGCSLMNYEARFLLSALYAHRPNAIKHALAKEYFHNEICIGSAHSEVLFYPFIEELVDSYPYKTVTDHLDEVMTWGGEAKNREDQSRIRSANARLHDIRQKTSKTQAALLGFGSNASASVDLFPSTTCYYLETHGFFPRPHSGPKEVGIGLLLERLATRNQMGLKSILMDLFPNASAVMFPETGESIEVAGTGPRYSRFEFTKEEDHEAQVFGLVMSILAWKKQQDRDTEGSPLQSVTSLQPKRSPFSDDGPRPVYQVTTSAPNVHRPPMLIESLELRIDGGRLHSDTVHKLLMPMLNTELPATLTVTRISADTDGNERVPSPTFGRIIAGTRESDKMKFAVPVTKGVASATAGTLMENFLPRMVSSTLLEKDQEPQYDSKTFDTWKAYDTVLSMEAQHAVPLLALEVDREKVTALLPEEKPSSPREAINFVIRFIRENVAYDHDLDDDVTHRQFRDDYTRGTLDANALWDHLFNPIRKTRNGKIRARCREIAFIATQLLRAAGIVTLYQNGRLVKENSRTTKRGHTHPAVLVSGKDGKPRLAFFYLAAGETIGTDLFPEDDTEDPEPNLWPLGIAAGIFGTTAFTGVGWALSQFANVVSLTPIPAMDDVTMAALATSAVGLTAVAATAIGAFIFSQRHQGKDDEAQKTEEEVHLTESGMRIPLKIKRGTLDQVLRFIYDYPYLADPTVHRYLTNMHNDGLPVSLDRALANVFPRRIRISKTHQASPLNTPEFIRRNTVRRREKMARLLEHATRPFTEEEKKEIAHEIARLEYKKEKTPLMGDLCDRQIVTLQEILKQDSLLNPEAVQIMRSLLRQDQERPAGWLPEVIVKP